MAALPVLSCGGCGVCCHLQHLPPYMPTELDVLPPALLKEIAAHEGETEGPCIWLLPDKRCKHYEQRPEVCRQFEMGEEDCLAMRQKFGI